MSQLISDFIIQPVVRQARRLSRLDSPNPFTTVTSNASIEFPEYVDPISAEYVIQQEREEDEPSTGTDHRRVIEESERRQNETELSTIEGRDRAETDPLAHRRQQRRHLIPRERFVSASAALPSTINEAGFRFMENSTMSATSNTAVDQSGDVPVIEPRLPEDDGMRNMRKRIQEVQGADMSTDQKSKMVHQIMVEQYMMSGNGVGLRTQSPSSLQSHERPFTPMSRESMDIVRMDSPGTSTSLAVEEMVVTAEDVKPTFWIPPISIDATPQQSRKNSIEMERHFGCEHYKRNVKLQCAVCMKWYTCRFCHDLVEDHCLNRQATKNMLCMKCGTAQLASGECKTCGFCAAYYFCKLCKLWDDDSTRPIYHCDSCGICRRGEGLGKDFFHCQKCSACIAMRLLDNHKCIERSTDCDCPICGEYMFTSPKTVVFMRCGHSIHYLCWTEHMKNSYKCPICSKSMVNMDLTFRQYDTDIEAQPMPSQFRDTKAWVFCNDCTNKSLVPFHWIGLKCYKCDSYNTARLQIISAPEDVELDEPENDIPAPELVMESEETVPETPATTELSIAPRVVDQRPEGQFSPTYTESSAVPMNIDTTDTGDSEEDEVEFWGGTSPRERALLQEAMRAEKGEAESDSDESMSDEDVEIMDDDEDDDEMAIFGHR